MTTPVDVADPVHDRCINALRFLAIDMVQQASSGHPGAPMGMAAMAYVLWTRHLRFNPEDPQWSDRDRFVLSAGHASALHYGLLHLAGFDLPLDELRRFRQYGSRTPGHPEYGLTVGVETTTGPLGQGFANGVGMALAEAALAARFNDDAHRIVDHHVYGICSDGDLMEGIASEAASLAGTLGLGKIVYLYDDNGITIDGKTQSCFTEDVGKRFDAYGWHVIGPIDGHDLRAVDEAILAGKAETSRPSLIVCKTHIGYGSPTKQDTSASHGAPLGDEEVARTREKLGWTSAAFEVPEDVYAHMRARGTHGAKLQRDWEARLGALAVSDPERASGFREAMQGTLPGGWESALDDAVEPGVALATRQASGKAINALAEVVTGLMGGSADLAGSNNTMIKSSTDFSREDRTGRNVHFGVREHAMAGIANGMALHGGLIPYVGTFLIFSDYMRPSIRLAALMEQRVVYVFTHDSIGLGEDGPTHQPVEQLAALRAIPNLAVIRPSDPQEVTEAWKVALRRADGPTALVLTRQKLPAIDRTLAPPATAVQRGAYVVRDADRSPEMLLLATGSEVSIVLEAADLLERRDVAVRVVAMPCWELFAAQPRAYQAEVLLPSVTKRLAVETAVSMGWSEWVGPEGDTVTLDRFGASAPWEENYRRLGFTPEAVVARALALLGREA